MQSPYKEGIAVKNKRYVSTSPCLCYCGHPSDAACMALINPNELPVLLKSQPFKIKSVSQVCCAARSFDLGPHTINLEPNIHQIFHSWQHHWFHLIQFYCKLLPYLISVDFSKPVPTLCLLIRKSILSSSVILHQIFPVGLTELFFCYFIETVTHYFSPNIPLIEKKAFNQLFL